MADPAEQTGRAIQRIYPIGVKYGPATLIAVCIDGSMWELERANQHGLTLPEVWRRLPAIPTEDA